jgi:hypothetical protein
MCIGPIKIRTRKFLSETASRQSDPIDRALQAPDKDRVEKQRLPQ